MLLLGFKSQDYAQAFATDPQHPYLQGSEEITGLQILTALSLLQKSHL